MIMGMLIVILILVMITSVTAVEIAVAVVVLQNFMKGTISWLEFALTTNGMQIKYFRSIDFFHFRVNV